jgi:RND family efflux transporter MFP subunit
MREGFVRVSCPAGTPAVWAVVVSLSLAACDGSERDGAVRAAPVVVPAVEVVQARKGALPLTERLTGTVRAAGEVAIFPQANGPIAQVYAQNGDSVAKGDPLVRIQSAGTRPQLEQARSSLQVAQAELKQSQARLQELTSQLERMLVLGDKGLLPRDTVDTQRAQVDAARADVARAKAQVAVAQSTIAERSELQQQTIVRAPISGRVGQRNAEVGMRVDSQTPLFVIGRLENMRVEVPVTQNILTHIREGQRVELRVAAQSEPIVARVSRISPFLEAGSYSAEVEVDVPNHAGAFVPGMFVTVDVFYGESEQATLVPVSALYDDPRTGVLGVFVASEPPQVPSADSEDGGAEPTGEPEPVEVPLRPVQVRAEGAQTVGLSGVEPGEWVVVVGQHLLSNQGRENTPRARVRAIDWNRILELQGMQRDDLLQQVMERQQRMAGERRQAAPEGRRPSGGR